VGGQASDAQIAAITEKYQLDQNYLVQYAAWLKNLVTSTSAVRRSSPPMSPSC
jgi:ABC-type dipeptide/oligopeptide/nickel transport system permease component